MYYLGLGKTKFNSSACLIKSDARVEIELILSERLLRKRATGVWPEKAIEKLSKRFGNSDLVISENGDVVSPLARELSLNEATPFFDYLKARKLEKFSRHFNSNINFITHHLCHAMAALAISPFEKSIIIVMDGAGSTWSDFETESGEANVTNGLLVANDSKPNLDTPYFEECSVYLQNKGHLQCVHKRWTKFERGKINSQHYWSESLGIAYEKAAEYIFNCKRAPGKVMGLAAFGTPENIEPKIQFFDRLDWSKSYLGNSKQEWESSIYLDEYKKLAATIQNSFEEEYFELLKRVRQSFPAYSNLILTGGCALNCTANGKLLRSNLFSEVFVPPFPGDESIGLGAASYSLYRSSPEKWSPTDHEVQHGYFGSTDSVPSEKEVERIFSEYKIDRPPSITDFSSKLLKAGHVIGWFQGRSESGPRALGNRSILANPEIVGIKEYLNKSVKFRESFRPYGASCTHEHSHLYFDVPEGFNSPYMSFAVKCREKFRNRLNEVTHIDSTSRIQTVRKSQNPIFHELIDLFGRQTGLFCILNTSLNVMGEPIVETIQDAKHFLEKTPVYGIALGSYFVFNSRVVEQAGHY